MAQDGGLMQALFGELGEFFEFVGEKLGDPDARRALASDLGARSTSSSGASFPATSESGLIAYRDAAEPDIEALFSALTDAYAMFEALHDFVRSLDFGGVGPPLEEVFDALLDLLATNYFRLRRPKLFFWMQFIGFTFETSSQFGEGDSSFTRFLRGFTRLITFAALGGEFSGDFQTDADARKWSFGLRLVAGGLAFIHGFGQKMHLWDRKHDAPLIDVQFGWDVVPGLPRTLADDVANRMLTVRLWDRPRDDDPDASKAEAATVSLALVPRDHGGPGVFIALGGQYEVIHALSERWQLIAKVNAASGLAFLFGGPKIVQFSGPDPDAADLAMSLALESVPRTEGGPSFAIPHTTGDRFEIGRIALSFALGSKSLEFRTSLHDCVLQLDGSSFDNFIGSMLPRENTKVEFSFGTGFSSSTGFFTTGDVPLLSGRGSAPRALPRATEPSPTPVKPPDLPVLSTGAGSGGIPIKIPIGKSLGPIRLHHVMLNIGRGSANESPGTSIGAALSFSGQIGPVEARVDGIGMKFLVDFPEDKSKANLHFANLDVGFMPPVGIGLAVDTAQVKGGGFLFHDAAKHQYGGVMELSLSGIISLKAIGIIATRLPDGSKGFSLLILITAENTNDRTSLLELPMGWRLTGIGGIFALHRTVDEEALRAGLRNRTLESILFPKDPVRNAPTIIAALDRVFPIKRKNHFFGAIVRLLWGVPTIITLDLALILAWGDRTRFIILGRVSSILPRVDHDLLRLKLDAIGIFNSDGVSIDAVLVDSRLLNRFPITGAAALRARWTSPRSFIVSVGGFNKGFTPPAEMPKLERVSISLTTGDNPRLTCESYFALTSNTVQWGARAELYAAAYGFNVQGEAGYDVLIRLVPFHFLAEIYAGMQLRKGSKSLFKIRVEGALEGPVPLSLRAKCTFEILWWDVSIRVNVTLGEGVRPPPPPAVSAFDQLRAALSDARSWTAELPRGQTGIVKLRESKVENEFRVHPLGTLTVRQSVVPLNLARDIDKFGESPVAGARRFTVSGVAIEGAGGQSTTPLQEDFAPAQFFEMTDEAKIASPSFEPMQAGLRIGATDFAFGFDQRIESPLDYETRVVDRSAPVAPPPPARDYQLTETLLAMHAWHGAAGRSALRREKPMAAKAFAKIEPTRFSRVAEDLAPVGARELTFAEALGSARDTRTRVVARESELVVRR